MTHPIILTNKNGLRFQKSNENHFTLDFSMYNKNIRLSEVINFDLIKLIYDLNPDVYEKIFLEKNTNNECNVTLLMKHLFEDIGLPQRYSHILLTKKQNENEIIFNSKPIIDTKPDWIPKDAELMGLKNMTTTCKIINQHYIDFTFDIVFEDHVKIPLFIEKMIGVIINKIFIRVKQFIENISVN